MEAAMTGHPVYTTLHSNSVAETVRRLVTTFPSDERQGRTVDILETVRLVVSQRLAPTVDGKRIALREFLIFDESVRDSLLDTDFSNITSAVRKMVRERGRPIVEDTREKFEAGLITERQFKLIAEQSKREEEDDAKGAGI
jgi:defect-in-organelle-trafficking protein DotB